MEKGLRKGFETQKDYVTLCKDGKGQARERERLFTYMIHIALECPLTLQEKILKPMEMRMKGTSMGNLPKKMHHGVPQCQAFFVILNPHILYYSNFQIFVSPHISGIFLLLKFPISDNKTR